MADIQSQIAQARSAGYDDAAIASHLGTMPDYSGKIKTALDAGYNPSDIISFLAPTTRKNVSAESDVPLLAADIRKLQKQKGETVTPDQKEIKSKGLLRRANDEILGAFEVPTTLITGAVGALAGIPAGIYESVKQGKYGTQEGVAIAQKRAEEIAKEATYKPQTAEGRRNLQAVGELVNSEALRPLQGAVNLPFNQLIPKGSVAPAVNYTKNVIGQEAKLAAQPITTALENRAVAKAAERTAESYARGPQIDAAKDANRLGILVDPAISNPTKGNKLRALTMDPTELHAKLAEENKIQYGNIAKAEMGLPENTPLTSGLPFAQARQKASAPYEAIRKIGVLAPDENVVSKIENLYDSSIIGGKTSENAIQSLIADATTKVNKGLTGSDVIKSISDLRKKATKAYNSNASTPEMIDVADVRMGIANALEDLIEANVSDPRTLTAFKKARADMAKIYSYEGATDLTTGLVDPQKLKRMLDKGVPLSGDAEAMARVAGNFPETVTLSTPQKTGITQLARSGVPGTIGAAIGSMAGWPGALAGGAIGAGVGKIATKVGANRIASPAYQAARAVPEDFRPPVNALRPVAPNLDRSLPVPYDFNNAVVQPGYTPNFTTPNQRPQFNPAGANPQLPAPSPESTLAGVESRRAYDLAAERYAAQQAEAQAAQQAPARAPTSGGVAFELDPVTGRLREVSQGMKGATPDVMQNYGTSLESAVNKVSAGKAFDLTAEERIAFNKTKVDLAQVEPGYAKLSDKQITERMMDRQWVADTIQKARQQAAAFEEIAARAKSEQARFDAMAQRQRMMDLADSMEEKMRVGRPDTSRKSQGPKTREAKRNALAGESENKNALAR